MGNAFINSLMVAIPATVIPITAAAFAAYAFSWMEFRGREVLFVIFVGLLVVPLQVAFIPLLKIYGNFGLNGTFLAVWLAHAGFGMPLAVYLFRNYMGSLPREVIESARVDGAEPLPDVLAADHPAVGAGAGGVHDLPVPVDLERPARRAGLPRRPGQRSRS